VSQGHKVLKQISLRIFSIEASTFLRWCVSGSLLASSLKTSLNKPYSSFSFFAANSNLVISLIVTSCFSEVVTLTTFDKAAWARAGMDCTFGRNIWRSVALEVLGTLAVLIISCALNRFYGRTWCSPLINGR